MLPHSQGIGVRELKSAALPQAGSVTALERTIGMPGFYKDAADRIVGPISSAELKTLAQKGLITRVTLISPTPKGPWVPAGQIRGFSTLFSEPSVATPRDTLMPAVKVAANPSPHQKPTLPTRVPSRSGPRWGKNYRLVLSLSVPLLLVATTIGLARNRLATKNPSPRAVASTVPKTPTPTDSTAGADEAAGPRTPANNASPTTTNPGNPEEDDPATRSGGKDDAPPSAAPPLDAQPSSDEALSDDIVTLVVGSASDHYLEHGYKGVSFDATLDELIDQYGIRDDFLFTGFSQRENPLEQLFLFNQDKQLYCYVRRYPGPLKDYKDELIQLFGICPNEATEWSVPQVRWVAFDYVFPRVVVRVQAVDAPREQLPVATVVTVVDRKWLTRVLEERSDALKSCIAWAQAWQKDFARIEVQQHKEWAPDLTRAHALSGCNTRLAQGEAVSGVEYTCQYGRNEVIGGSAILWDGRRLGTGQSGPVPIIECRCSLLPGMDRERHYKNPKRLPGLPAEPALAANPFLDQIAVNLLLRKLQEVFPPDPDPETGKRLYQIDQSKNSYSWHWTDDDGDRWLVMCNCQGKVQSFGMRLVGQKRSL